MNHKTKKISIKKAEVDIGIIPLVDFLNSFNGITTRWSCEGNPDNPKKLTAELPYITFYAEDLQSIHYLLRDLQNAPCSVEIDYYNDFVPMRFLMRFGNQAHLHMMIKWIKEL